MSEVTVFARIAGQPHVAQFDWKSPAVDLPIPAREQIMDVNWIMPEGNPIAAVDFVLSDNALHAKLPELTMEQAHEVAEACYHSGAYMDVAAVVLAHSGQDAFQTYCEFQSYEGMRNNSDVPKSESKWYHSGLSADIIKQYQGV